MDKLFDYIYLVIDILTLIGFYAAVWTYMDNSTYNRLRAGSIFYRNQKQ